MMTTIAHRHFHQRDEIAVRLFVSGVIVARRSRVFDLTVVGHPISPNLYPAPADLA